MIRIGSVEPLHDFVVRLEFTDGTVSEVDLRPVIWGESLRARAGCVPRSRPHLSDPDFFRSVYVDRVSGTIAWPNDTDLDPDVLYALATGTYDELMGEETASG